MNKREKCSFCKRRILFSGSILLIISWLSSCKASHSITQSDYTRAESFSGQNISKKIYHLTVDPHWFNQDSEFWYRTNTREGEVFFRVYVKDSMIQPAFNQQKTAAALSQLWNRNVDEGNLPFNTIHFNKANQVEFRVQDTVYEMDLNNYSIHSREISKENEKYVESMQERSPDSQWIAFSKNDNLYLANPSGKDTVQLTSDGHHKYEYASYYGWDDIIYGEDGKRPEHFTAEWSPDSKKILTQICDLRTAKKMYLLNWSIDSLYRAPLMSYYRGSPGDTDIVKYIPVIFDVNTRKMIRVDLPPVPHFIGVDLRWTDDGKHLYGIYYHRGYKQLDIIEVNPETGKVRTVISDSNETYVENNTDFRYLQDQGIGFITSERSGWNQLYRFNWATGGIQPVTTGEFVFKQILYMDTLNKTFYFTATGKEKGENPYFLNLYRVNFDGSDLKLLTPENASHDISISPEHHFFVDNYSTATQPTISVLRSLENGSLVMQLGKADISDLLANGWRFPQIFTAVARDNKTTIYGALWKPTNFKKNKKYPIIDNSYTGPQINVFPVSFRQSVFSNAQPLAEFGFVVMSVDGLGSAGRSKAFHNWSYRHMTDNLADHVLAIRQLADNNKWIDTSRVGIFGHSAGGYDAAHALMRFPGFYKVAVAASGDHDWRMEKAWWPEMFVGWPVDSIYQQQSNITMAPQMQGKILLVHGGIDENVNPAATFKLANSLIKAGKYFDMLIIPAVRHGYTEPYGDYFVKKQWNYFIENLLHEKPIE